MDPRLSALREYIDVLGSARRTVTSVVIQSRRRDRVSVFVDGDFAFGVSDEVAARHGLHQGAILDRKLLEAVRLDETITVCKRVALRYVSYRMRSEAEVRRRLAKEGAGSTTIDMVLDRLREIGVVDDAAFAHAYARDAVSGRKWGPFRIAQGLRKAGVRKELITEAVKRIQRTVDEEGLIEAIATKRWNQLSDITDVKKRKKRLYDYLVRRGFDFDDVRRVLEALSKS